MKIKFPLVLIALFAFTIQPNIVLAQSAVPNTNYGVWNRGGDPSFDPNQPNYDYIVGVTKGPTWDEIQDTPSSFNWSEMQQAIDFAFDNDQLVTLKINVGPECPDWIYSNGVPLVETDDDKFLTFPYYLDQEYINFYYALIDEFAAFIFSLPQEKQDILSFIFPQNGATGDEVPYKGDLTPESINLGYDISDAEWETFRINSWNHWKAAFRDNQSRPIPFLFNDLDLNSVEWNWVTNNIGNDFGIKNSNAYARGHHLTNEKIWNETYTQFLVDPQGLELFNRAEMDQSWTKPLYNINPELGFYWGAIGGLSTGLSIWDVTTSALEFARNNTSVQETFRFFTKYATQVDPSTSTKAFIVLHEGLNAADTVKFPEVTYGNPSRTNIERYEAICNDPVYAARGALMDDPQSANDGQVSQRSNQTGYNDAGWDIWPTNYGRFITQVNPDAESIGLFRIGGAIDENSSIYSRFARSFDNSAGKNAMYFKMDDNFFSSAAGVVKISVIYYDNNANSTWELKYDAGEGNFKTAFTITDNTGSNTWKTRTIIVDDAVMLHNGTQEADFALINTDSEDDIFHRIEIEQLNGSDTVSITSPVYGEQFILDKNPNVIVDAIGYDSEGIQSMRFKIDDGAFIDDISEPYSNVFSDLTEGEHTLLVQMLDNQGNTLDAEQVIITVLATTPIDDFVVITSPMDGGIFPSGADITVVADGFDNQDIDVMRFQANGGDFFNDSTPEPYSNLFAGLPDGDHTFVVQMKDNDGNRITSEEVTITISGTLSTNKEETNQYRIYPTIVADILNWKLNNTIHQIRIFDIAGREIIKKKVNNSNSINLSILKSGIYLVLFEDKGNGIVSKKIIKL